MEKVQEIDPLEELRLITEAWAEAHNMEAFVVVATRQEDGNTYTYSHGQGNTILQEGILRRKLEIITRLTEF